MPIAARHNSTASVHGEPFPLPFLGVPEEVRSSTPRYLAKRLRWARIRQHLVEEATGSLKALSTFTARGCGPIESHHFQATPVQQSILSRIGSCVARFGHDAHKLSDDAALLELLRQPDFYSEGDHRRVAYDPARLKFLQSGIRPRELSERLHGEAAEILGNAATCIERAEGELEALYMSSDEPAPQPYWDPSLRDSQARRLDLFSRLCSVGLGGWRSEIKGTMGIFFVEKRS